MITVYTCPECGHDLQDIIICTYPPIPRKECPSCGWSWEGEPEKYEINRVPFDPDNPDGFKVSGPVINKTINNYDCSIGGWTIIEG